MKGILRKVQAHRKEVLGIVLVLLWSAAAVAQPSEGEPVPGEPKEVAKIPAEGVTLWATSGRLFRGTARPVVRTKTPREEQSQVTDETREQLAKLQKRAARDGQHPEGPALRFEEAIDLETIRPLSAETVIDLATKASDDFTIFENSIPSSAAPSSGFSSTVNEPTAVISGAQALYTANWFAARSSDGGATWTLLNPFNGPFAPVNDGFCCDQVSVHHPATNTIFLLQQYVEDGTTGTQRINVDQDADGSFECAFDFQPQDMGFATNNWADFPDLAISDNFVYHSSNVFSTTGGGFSGAFAARYPLAEMSACQVFDFDVVSESGFGSFRFTRGATDTMYFADHISLASLRIWSWPEASTSPTTTDRAVTPWLNSTRSCAGPDGRDWCGFIDHRMSGGYVADGVVGFLWMPSQGGAFPYPYTRVARFAEGALSPAGESDIWSATTAYVYPSVAVNASGELGGTMLFGGGDTFYPSCLVWLADEVNGGSLSPLESEIVALGTTGPGQNRSGDYTWTQPSYPDRGLFVAACFAYEATSHSTSRFVKFGREKNGPIFTDGFESGDTNAWGL